MGKEKHWSLTSSFFMLLYLHYFLFLARARAESFIYAGCTQDKYDPGSSFSTNLNSMLTSFVNSASSYSYNNFSIPGPDAPVYGLYKCRGDLSLVDC
jgi:hypothetical protein